MAHGGIAVSAPYTMMPEAYNSLAAARNRAIAYAPAFGYYAPPPLDMSGMMLATAHFSNSRSPHGAPQPPVESQYVPSRQPHPSIRYRGTPGTPSLGAPVAPCPLRSVAYAAEEACKVIVTSIQHKAWQSEVFNWIHHQIGEHSSAIMSMDVPLTKPKGRIRGHAFVTLANPTAAEATVRILDQKLFRGRVVAARMITERSVDSRRSSPPNKEIQTSRQHRLEPGKSIKHASATELGKPPRGAEQSTRPRNDRREFPLPNTPPQPYRREGQRPANTSRIDGPVIAYGSSTRRKG